MPEPNQSRIHAFEDSAAFWAWLEANHATESELWLKIFKKASGTKTINWEEAVIEALCWGWIDGQARPLDEVSWLVKFTPRGPRSTWSQVNVGLVDVYLLRVA
jgi:uncharacterized protein YdeI (YjbR/CyaY-like superfamily)